MNKKNFVYMIIVCSVLTLLASSLFAQVGKSVRTVKLKNVYDAESIIPNIGKKVLVNFYIDPDVHELNDPLSDALDSEKFPTEKFSVIGIVNCKDTWIPNAAIRDKAKKKQERFPKSIILLDEEHSVAKSWKLENSDNKLIVVLIGLDAKIKYFKSVESLEESKKIIPEFLQTIKAEIDVQSNK